MPITYHIDSNLRLALMRVVGAVSVAELRESITQLIQASEHGTDLRILVDLSGMNTSNSRKEMTEYGEWRKQFPKFWQTAFVGPADLEFGLANMFAGNSRTAGAEEMEVFRTLKEARDWLGLPDS